MAPEPCETASHNQVIQFLELFQESVGLALNHSWVTGAGEHCSVQLAGVPNRGQAWPSVIHCANVRGQSYTY